MNQTSQEVRISRRPGKPPQSSLKEGSPYFVYVLQNTQGRLYIGFTADLERRVRQHQKDKGGWTCERGPWGAGLL